MMFHARSRRLEPAKCEGSRVTGIRGVAWERCGGVASGTLCRACEGLKPAQLAAEGANDICKLGIL